MKAKQIIAQLEELAPPSLQESYDNSGIMCGNPDMEVKSALFSLDCTEEVVDEAIEKGVEMLICHHPLIFGSLKSISGKNEIERCLIKAIKADLMIYAIHTNLDNVINGVNAKIAEKIGLQNCSILRPMNAQLSKLVFFVPTKQAELVRNAIFEAGGGEIGNYSHCSFNSEGEGTFKANEAAEPFVGEKGKLHFEKEQKVEVIFPNYLQSKILSALISSHPYEEVAYDLYPLNNQWREVGSGMIGELDAPIPVMDFLKQLKKQLKCDCIRHTKIVKDKIQKVALCGGSGSFLLKDAIRNGADVFVSGDFKYHQFFEAENSIMIADVGHYESEQFTPELLKEFLQEKIPNFATYLTRTKTNPINYL
ncbi:MAG: Nif3-like dinuclear metal center hexameric protein [Flavobacteriales bacterium]|nr:Nif3-like dinuclear metal center hexameric protein [Flavobacteriales bacterium]